MGASEGHEPARDLLEVYEDDRGVLSVAAFDSLPFLPERAYVLHGIPVGAARGGHANRRQHRWLAVISGSIAVTEDDGRSTRTFELGSAASHHLPPGVWHELRALSPDVVILVLASGPHDPSDYVRERSAMPLALVRSAEQTS